MGKALPLDIPATLLTLCLSKVRGLRFACLLLLFTIQPALSDTGGILRLDTVMGNVDANPYLYFLEDPNNTMALSDVLDSTAFSTIPKKTFNAGFSDSAWWFRITIQPSSLFPPNTLQYFELHTRYLDYLDLWIFRDGQLENIYNTGLQRPFSDRGTEAPNFIFPLMLNPDQTLDLYMRASGNTTFTIPVALWSPDALQARDLQEQTIFGMYYGIIIIMALYNLFIYISTRDESYLYYVGYVFFLLVFHVCITGFGHQHVWRDQFWLLERITTLSSFAALFLGLSFTRCFLHTQQNSPKTDTAIRIIQCIAVIMSVSAVIHPSAITHQLQFPFSYAWIAIIIFATTRSLLSGYRTARFFALGWFFMILGVGIKSQVTNGNLPNNFFTMYSVMFGSCIEVVLLSIALADRINHLNKDNKRLQQNSLSLLKESNQLKDQFLATISHELRTPMNGVEGSLQLIDHDTLPAESSAYIQSASRSAQEMTSLIDKILHFSEVQSGSLAIANTPFDLDVCLRSIATHYRTECTDKGLTFRCAISMKNHLFLGDRDKIAESLHIILENAVKFTTQGSVTLQVVEKSHQSSSHSLFHISISDTGIGIPTQPSLDLFEPFLQLDNSYSRRFGGLGIGLAIAKGLLNSMSADITFVPCDKGTTFKILLTLEKTSTVAAIEPSAPLKKHSPTGLPVLVVEDNPVNQMVLSKILERSQLTVLTAENGRKALEVLGENRVSMIFMDCQMPLMDGFETTRAIRATESGSDSHLPIIAVTANATSTDRLRCLESGMDDYVKKPIKPDSITSMLKKWHPGN